MNLSEKGNLLILAMDDRAQPFAGTFSSVLSAPALDPGGDRNFLCQKVEPITGDEGKRWYEWERMLSDHQELHLCSKD